MAQAKTSTYRPHDDIETETRNTKISAMDWSIHVLPKTLITTISTFIATWFGFGTFAKGVKPFGEKLQGVNGEKLPFGDRLLRDDLYAITKRFSSRFHDRKDLKPPPHLTNAHWEYTNAEAAARISEAADRWGFAEISEHMRPFLNDTGQDVVARANLQNHLMKLKGNKFADLFLDAWDSWLPSEKNLDLLRDDAVKIIPRDEAMSAINKAESRIARFATQHERAVINRFRLPATVALTASALAGVGWASWLARRQDVALNNRVDDLTKFADKILAEKAQSENQQKSAAI